MAQHMQLLFFYRDQEANPSQGFISEQLKQDPVEIKMAVIEAELGLIGIQRELVPPHAMKLRQSMLGVTPERLNAVDVPGSLGKFVLAVIAPQVLVQPQINQPIAASPAIGVDDAIAVNFAADDALHSVACAMRLSA